MARVASTSFMFMFDEVPRAGLVDVDRELVVVRSADDLVGGADDRLGDVGVEDAQLGVDERGGAS